jgi:hypothetical protein
VKSREEPLAFGTRGKRGERGVFEVMAYALVNGSSKWLAAMVSSRKSAIPGSNNEKGWDERSDTYQS